MLPRSHWGPLPPPLHLDDHSYAHLVTAAENIVRRLLVSENYDSISNFISLYVSYEQVRQRFSLREVYLNFVPVCRPHEYTCVGLALELMRRWKCLEERFPGLGAATGLLSCEETAPHVLRDTHMTQGPHELVAPDKEHVMVGVQISFNGRRGVLIADPGYHVGKIITIMVDNEKPHTGWFNQILDGDHRKDFLYYFCNHNLNYIVWREEERRKDDFKLSNSLIYASRPFCGGICVTEKRNLVYRLKSLVRRTHTGIVVAGMIFFLCPDFNQAKFTIFYSMDRQKVKKQFYFKLFTERVSEEVMMEITIFNAQLNFPEGRLLSIIYRLVKILSDESFVRQCIELNSYIMQCSIWQRDYLWSLQSDAVKQAYRDEL